MEIGNIDIDFIVDTNFDPNLIIVGDMSKWYNAENLPSTICITPPGFTKSINNTFIKHKLNIFNSVNLGLSCLTECNEQKLVDLLDGIWTITVKSGYEGIEKTRYLLKTDRFTMELDKIYIKIGLEYDRKDNIIREDLNTIEFLMRTAEAWMRQGNFVKAGRDFTESQNILKKYSDCKNCL